MQYDEPLETAAELALETLLKPCRLKELASTIRLVVHQSMHE